MNESSNPLTPLKPLEQQDPKKIEQEYKLQLAFLEGELSGVELILSKKGLSDDGGEKSKIKKQIAELKAKLEAFKTSNNLKN